MTPSPGTTEAAEILASSGTGMIRRFGWLYDLLGLGDALSRIRLEEHSAERVRLAAEKGPVVYVLLERSGIDHLALNAVLEKRGLPLTEWSNGPLNLWWRPWREAVDRLFSLASRWWKHGTAPDPVRQGLVARAVAQGTPITVFLEQPPTLQEWWSGEPPSDALAAVLDAQAKSERPIQILPALVVWDRSPDHADSAVRWFLGGSEAGLGFIQRMRRLLWASHQAFVQVGDAVDLATLFERIEPERRELALRMLVRRYLHRESTVVRGPRLLPRHVMRRLVLDNPPMRDLAHREAEASGRSDQRVRQQMERDFDKIAANFRWWVIELLNLILKPVWTRIYSGVDVRPEDLERIRTAMRSGATVLVPSHKSHFDYLLLSWVFYQHDLIVPHVVAGMNLAIWPVSLILRGAGGFFVKRSFTGDRIFPAVFSRYLRELIRQDYPVEFFIEGGRTRSGKLMPPKLGVLGMVFEASELRRHDQQVTLLPIAFAYEQVAEEQAYARELGGEEKQAESVGQLVRARSVLSRRFGRVYLRVGEPIAAAPLVDASAEKLPWHQRPREEQKELLQTVGEDLVARIGQVTLVLPTSLVALALLAHPRRGVRHDELLQRVERFREFLQRQGAMEAISMSHASQALQDAVLRFHRAGLIEPLDHQGERIWAIHVDRRITLDFHKNQVLHFFAAAGYATAAIRTLPVNRFTIDDLQSTFSGLLWTLRREFVFDPEKSSSELLNEGLESLVAHGALISHEGEFEVADEGRIGEIYLLFRSLFEGYHLLLTRLPDLAARGLSEKEIPKVLQTEAISAASLPESLSIVTLQNALSALKEERVIEIQDSGKLLLNPSLREGREALLRPMVH